MLYLSCMPAIVGIFYSYEQNEFRAQLSWAWRKFYYLGARYRGYTTVFMLNSTEHDILAALKKEKCEKNKEVSYWISPIYTVHPKMQTIGILTFRSRTNNMPFWDEHELVLKPRGLGPELQCLLKVKEDFS